MLGLRPDLLDRLGPIHLDLLDDWTVHRGFQCIWSEAEEAYERLFSVAHSVSANSEGTLALAERFGRGDALLLPNGVDPERFSSVPLAQGPITVGYVGKIGRRLDSNLIATTIKAFPSVKFVFAGPVLERGYVDEVAKLPNVHMLGDVHYSSVPDLLSTFDIGWVPHDVENGQVGGDAIKIYEYRASGLPVVTTPIIGTRERPIDGVRVVNAIEQLDCLKELVSGVERVPREPMTIPPSMTWENKAQRILNSLMLND